MAREAPGYQGRGPPRRVVPSQNGNASGTCAWVYDNFSIRSNSRLWKTYCMLEYLRQLEREWFGRGGSKNGSAAVHGWCRRQCAPSPKHAPTRLPPAGPPEALAEFLCRRRRRRSNG